MNEIRNIYIQFLAEKYENSLKERTKQHKSKTMKQLKQEH